MIALVTGGTGLIGRHLVARLLRRGHEVRVLLRPGARARRASVLEGWAKEGPGTLRLVEGDLGRDGPQLGPDAFEGLDHVFHLAAVYDLDASEATLRDVNVDGTRRLLAALAAAGFGGVLHHASSMAVAGDHRGAFDEGMFDIGQGHPHPYHQSKFDAEALVRGGDLRWRIYRPSAVVGHSATGAIDAVDGPLYLFKALQRLGRALPGWFPLISSRRGALNMVPVDFVADALDALAHAPGLDGRTFHLVDPDPPPFRDTVNELARLAGAPRIRAGLRGPLRGMVQGAGLGSLGAVRALRDHLLADADIPASAIDAFNDAVALGAAETTAALAPLGVRCPPQRSYLAAQWCYWLQHLDPDRDPAIRQRARLAGKVVLITGASSGVGAALAEQCAALGATALLAARRAEQLEEVAARIREAGGKAATYPVDLSSLDACDELCQRALADHGRVDILVNNAARSIHRHATESLARYHDFERVMQLNYFAPVRLMRALLPGMRERGDGHVVNVLTAGVALPTPRFSAYGASKAALSHLTGTLGAEYLHEGLHFTAVYLGWVRTPMMEATGRYKDTSAQTPAEAAAWILDGIVHRRPHVKAVETTRRWVLNGLAPRALQRIVNLVARIYDDDAPDPAFAPDRALLGRFIKGRPI